MTNSIVFRPNNQKAYLFLFSWLMFVFIGLLLSVYVNLWIGQFVLGIAFFQTFVLLHETGHNSFFEQKHINTLMGHFFGFLSMVPFISWVDIHNLHHKWTGWRDKDPTTSGTINPDHGIFLSTLVNVCWFLFIPLFTIGYRMGNFWNLKKLKSFSSKTNQTKVVCNMIGILFVWSLIIVLFPLIVLKYILPAFIVGLIISDLIILSQHSHIDIPVSDGESVKPLKYGDQVKYTRSIKITEWIDHWILFNFNMHGKHHEFPGIPAYELHKKNAKSRYDSKDFLNYLKKAKSLSGEDFIFSTRSKTGKEV